jgi:hypothetical protein
MAHVFHIIDWIEQLRGNRVLRPQRHVVCLKLLLLLDLKNILTNHEIEALKNVDGEIDA